MADHNKSMKDNREEMKRESPDATRAKNRDRLSGAPGSHVGGTAAGGAAGAAAGAAIGSPGGPLGAVVGGAIGAIAGAFAGKGFGEWLNPTKESEYWADNYKTRPYVIEGADFSNYESAYRYGYESRARFTDRSWNDVEPELARDWERSRGESRLDWQAAQPATRDAWERAEANYQNYLRSMRRDKPGTV